MIVTCDVSFASFATFCVWRNIGQFRPCADIGSALMHELFRKTNGNEPFVQCSNVDLFCDSQCIFKLDTKISYCAVNFCVTQQ